MAIIVETKINGASVNTATTATPTADSVPVADGAGKLAAGWGGAASTLATLDGTTKVVEDPASATATPTATSIPIADGSGKLAAGWGGAASSLATLDGSTKVVEDPASATATPTASSIPIADGSGKLAAGWGGAASSLATLNGSSLVVEDPANTALPKWSKYTVAATAFTAAATTEDIELFQLPAQGTIHRVVIKHSTAFSGGTASAVTLSVGITGTLTKYAAAFDVFQATGNTVFGFNDLPGMENAGAATSIRVEAVATGDNLVNVTTGSADIWVLTSTLPA